MLLIFFLLSCSKYRTIKSRYFFTNKINILSRKLYPGRYILQGKTKDIGKVNYYRISNIKNHPTNYIRKLIRDRIFFVTLRMSDEYRGLLLSIILNEPIPKQFKFLYDLGLGHYFAISGLHISIILSLFKLNSLILNIIFLIILYIYSLTIFSPSIIRASIFAFFKILSIILGEERDIKKEFLISLILSLIIFGHNSLGLQLTFIASSIFILFPDKSLYQKSILISLITIPSLSFHLGKFNLLSFIPNIILSFIFYLMILSCFLNIILPINFITVLLMKIIVKLSSFFNNYLSFVISYNISTLSIIIFYTIFLLIYLRKK